MCCFLLARPAVRFDTQPLVNMINVLASAVILKRQRGYQYWHAECHLTLCDEFYRVPVPLNAIKLKTWDCDSRVARMPPAVVCGWASATARQITPHDSNIQLRILICLKPCSDQALQGQGSGRTKLPEGVRCRAPAGSRCSVSALAAYRCLYFVICVPVQTQPRNVRL